MTKSKIRAPREPIFTQECYICFRGNRHVRLFTGPESECRKYFSKDRVWSHEFRATSRLDAIRETRAKVKELSYSTGIKHKFIT